MSGVKIVVGIGPECPSDARLRFYRSACRSDWAFGGLGDRLHLHRRAAAADHLGGPRALEAAQREVVHAER